MIYDFETIPQRKGTGAEKWEMMYRAKPDVGADIVPLSVADMELKNPPEIVRALHKYIDDTVPGYSIEPKGYFDAVCDYMQTRHSWTVSPQRIVVTPGVVPALLHIIPAVTEKDDGVIIMTPVYYPFYKVILENGRRVVKNPLLERDGRYTIDFENLEQLAKEKRNTALLLCSPHNPVGRVWTKEELSRIAEICLANDVFVIADEIHFDLIMPGHSHTVFATISEEMAQRTVTCTAPSKTYNLAGLNLSNVVAADETVREKLRSAMGFPYCAMQTPYGYVACMAAYEECGEWLRQLLAHIDGNRRYVEDFVAEHLPYIKVTPLEGTYLQWLDCRALGLSKEELERAMIAEDLFFDEGYIFGDEGIGFERINLACPKIVIEKAMERFARAVKACGALGNR